MRYAILSTGRNGGNVLCDVLSQTGVAGMVGKDGGYRGNELNLGHGEGLKSVDVPFEAFKFFRASATPNGVEGIKINYQYLVCSLQRWVGWRVTDDILLSLDKAVVLTRRDKVAQAVSRHIASEEMVWASWQKDKGKTAEYNGRAIANFIACHAAGDAYFIEFCRQHQIPHIVAEYETMAVDFAAYARHLLQFLEISDEGVDWDAIEPRLKKQFDPRKAVWCKRYREERGLL